MSLTRWLATSAGLAVMASLAGSTAHAQGATTGAITGTVTDPTGRPLANVQVQIVNTATGFRSGQLTRENGRYFVQNLEVGRGYSVTARLIGYAPQTRTNVVVTLSQATRADFQLTTQATQLTAVTVTANTATDAVFSPTRQGSQTVVSDTLIQRIPTLNRDVTDLVRLTPQVTNQTGGFSAAGSNPRLSQITIDGANQSDRFALNNSGGVPGGNSNNRLVPIDAVKEVQVSLTPTDVRLANFAGVLVNAVTRNGTNTWTGGGNFTFRNPSLARDTTFIRTGNLRQQNYGLFLGGPIIRDRLHFFSAVELQERDSPNGGPSFGANPAPTDTVQGGNGVTFGQVQRAQQIAQQLGFNAGSGQVLSVQNPLTNFIGRLDYRLNENTRFVLRQLVNQAEAISFSRNATNFNPNADVQGTGFRLTSNQAPNQNRNYSTVFQAFTNLPKGVSNEFSAAYNRISDVRTPPLQTPEISVSVRGVSPTAGQTTNAQITFGTEQFSTVNVLRQGVLELTNNVTVPLEAHTLTFGARFENSGILNDFQQRSFGAYKFSSLDSLANRLPNSYSVAYANGPGIAARFSARMYSGYVQDQWTASPRVTVTAGLRADVPQIVGTPAENPQLASAFATRGVEAFTNRSPRTRVLFSPRLGANWDVRGNQTLQLRANTGLYTGQPPYILVGNAFSNTGRGLATLTCTGTGNVPTFTTETAQLPRSCQGQPAPAVGAAGTAGINVTDPNFRFPQRFVSTVGADVRLPASFVFTLEGIYGRDVNGIRVRDLNLLGPRIVGGQPYSTNTGRVLYADTIRTNTTTGNVPITDACFNVNTCSTRAVLTNGENRAQLTEGAIYLTNQSRAYNYAVTPSLRKRFSQGLDVTAAYTYTRAFEVQSFTSDRAISIWRNGREYAGLESSNDLTTSAYEQRHRVQLYGTYTLPFSRRFPTDLTWSYTANSGSPLTFTAQGDLNGDGFNNNDPIYVPRSATDPSEIRIVTLQNPALPFNATTNPYVANAQAAQRFEDFIASQPCLNSQRGRIFERNTCRNPVQQFLDVSVRQSLPTIRGQRVSAQLDVFNFLNLLNNEWGVNRGSILSNFPQQQVLIVRQRSTGPLSNEKANVAYEFDSRLTNAQGRPQAFQDFVNSVGNVYRMQLTFRYSF